MDKERSELVAKVPLVTFLFWIVKVLATTLGETAGDAVTMAVAGFLFFHEPPSWQRIVGIAFAVTGLFLLSK